MKSLKVVFIENKPGSKIRVLMKLSESAARKRKHLRHRKLAAFIRSLYRD